MSWYFAYGANMSQRVMQLRGVKFTQRERAWLDGWKREFAKVALPQPGQGYATIVEAPSHSLESILYLCPDGLARLDEFEGVAKGYYSRRPLPVRRENGEVVDAEVYIAQPESIQPGLKPSRDYLEKLLGGRDLLSPEAIEELEQTEVWTPPE